MWSAQTAVTHDGRDALKISGVGGGQAVALAVSVTGDATISFYWRLATSTAGDLAWVRLNGEVRFLGHEGATGWRKVSLRTGSPGTHTLVWNYSKTAPDGGKDALFIDDLRIQTAAATSSPRIVRQSRAAQGRWGDSAALEVEAAGGGLFFQWYEGMSGDTSRPVPGATSPRLLTPPLTNSSDYWVRVSNARGAVDSQTAAVSLIARPTSILHGMGDGKDGQLGPTFARGTPKPIDSADDVVAIAAGFRHTLFIRADGSLWAMGLNNAGQLGDGTTENRAEPVHVADDVAQAAAGFSHSLFLKTDGTLWAMGSNGSGQLGDGSTTTRHEPVQVATDVASVTAGGAFTLFIKSDGTLWATGQNNSGQLGDGSTSPRATPLLIAHDVAQAAAGAGHSLFLKNDGSIWGMGSNSGGQLGDGTGTNRLSPVQIASAVTAVSAGNYGSFFIKTDGTLWGMGSRYYGELGGGNSTQSQRWPTQITTEVAAVGGGGQHTLFLKTDGTLWTMGGNDHGQLGDGFLPKARRQPGLIARGVAHIAAGGEHSLFVGEDGRLWGVGRRAEGQLGAGDAGVGTSPTPTTLASRVTQISAGQEHTLFVTDDGSLWAAGQNEAGQLGDGSTVKRGQPVQVATEVRQAVAGAGVSLFVKADRSLWLSGYDSIVQVGSGAPTTERATPRKVAQDVRFAASCVGRSYFITDHGSLMELNTHFSANAQATLVAQSIAQVAPGASHLLFLKTDGTLWARGVNTFGQLGDGTKIEQTEATPVARDVVKIAAGAHHSLFIKADGTLWGMGLNYYGELGAGSPSTITTPVQISSDVAEIAAGQSFTLFIKTDRSVWAMGRNDKGQLGDGTEGNTAHRAAPVQISAGGVSLAAGTLHSLLLTSPFHRVEFALGEHGERAGDGSIVQYVPEGSPVLAPAVDAVAGRVFSGWDHQIDSISGDLAVHAIYRLRQTIFFSAPTSLSFVTGATPGFHPMATSSSGLPVAVTVKSGPATMGVDGSVTITDAGSVTLVATQAGDDAWAPAEPVERIIVVSGKKQTITFPAPPPSTYGAEPFPLSASASSGLPVAFSVVSGPAVLGETGLQVTGVGRVILQADQSGGNGFSIAPPIRRVLVVHKAPLLVRALSAERLVGDANPSFELVYSGFVGEDALDPDLAIAGLDHPPRPVVKATPRSPAGSYPISISGGVDDRYTFVAEKPAGTLLVKGFGGTYEALITNGPGPGSIPLGKLTLTLSSNTLSYTGRLTLAGEAKPMVVTSLSANGITGPFGDFGDGASVAATWFTGDTAHSYQLKLMIDDEGVLTGTLRRNGAYIGVLEHGRRLQQRGDPEELPPAGRHTLLFYPATGMFEFSGPAPEGFGHATGSISAKGGLSFRGKLADGLPITANVHVTRDHRYLFWRTIYPKRPGSFLAGAVTPSHSPEANVLVWKQAPLVGDPAAPAGFGHLQTHLALDAWVPPSAARSGRPAVSLPQRLGLVDTPASGAIVTLRHESESVDLSSLPEAALLLPSGRVQSEATNSSKWRFAVNATTGSFTGSFELADPGSSTGGAKTVKFSGVLRRGPHDDGVVGGGFLDLSSISVSPDPGAPATGQIRLLAPGFESP